MIQFSLPLLGFCAYSGTGKTTLLTKLIPLLTSKGLRVGVVKHAHHAFDIDYPEKDSYKLRHAGATQMVIASRKRLASITEFEENRPEPELAEVLSSIQANALDLVLVEGFKKEAFPKIELHRPSLGNPLFFPQDDDIIAIASDAAIPVTPRTLPLLDLNQPDEIADFILYQFLNKPEQRHHAYHCNP